MLPERQSRQAANLAASNVDETIKRVPLPRMKLADLSDFVEHFRSRVLQDALTEATAAYWNRRAEQFAAVGNERCDEIAQACRNKARLALGGDSALVCPTCATPLSPWSCSCGETRIEAVS